MLELEKKSFRMANTGKPIFTAGPASMLEQNISNLGPCFGRGDPGYESTRSNVLNQLAKISGKETTVEMQGSGTLAIEVMLLNFAYGKVFVVDTGYYSDRIYNILKQWSKTGRVSEIRKIPIAKLDETSESCDWLVACPTETSNGLLTPISRLRNAADRCGAKLMLDATASIGLEEGHELADVLSYSSCKGLFGLTGACFVSYDDAPQEYFESSFYLNLKTHENRGVTGPYHTMQSLEKVLSDHAVFKNRVHVARDHFVKRFKENLVLPKDNQPNLCTAVDCEITPQNDRVLLYKPRQSLYRSIVCHIGVVHLEPDEIEKFYDTNIR